MSHRDATNLPTARADFNRHDVDGRYAVGLARFPDGVNPRVGDEVLLHDPEGNSVRAVVTDVSQDAALLEPAWGTWRSESGPPTEVPGPARRRVPTPRA